LSQIGGLDYERSLVTTLIRKQSFVGVTGTIGMYAMPAVQAMLILILSELDENGDRLGAYKLLNQIKQLDFQAAQTTDALQSIGVIPTLLACQLTFVIFGSRHQFVSAGSTHPSVDCVARRGRAAPSGP
jgi:hypothetical protein